MLAKKILIFLLLLGVVVFFFFKPAKFKNGPTVDESEIYQSISYEAVDRNKFEVFTFTENLFSPTRIKITPDGKRLLVSQITGEVLAFDRDNEGWKKEPYLFTKIETMFSGFPPDEAGLVGMIFSNDYENNKKVFLLYTFKDKEGKVQNRISVTSGGKPKLIWQANIPGSGSHQITDGLAIKLNGEDRLVFLIGEGFEAKRAQDPNLHAGKLLSIKEDGSDTKIHALGIRNGYALSLNPFDKDGRILISDSGPEKYDRLIYTNPFINGPLNFGWNGDEKKLAKAIPDPNFPKVSDMVILRLTETRTFTGLAFTKDGNVLATLFGKTGFKDNSPGKEILLGKLDDLNSQPKISFKTIIKRVKEADGKFGNPIGLETDLQTGDFFFADILEGRIYQVKEKVGMGVNK